MAHSSADTPRTPLEEGAPLLSRINSEEEAAVSESPKEKKPWIILCVLLFLLVSIVDVGAFLAEAPRTRVYEANLCLRYYEEHDPTKIGPGGTIPEELCKQDTIQQKMAMIFGWQDLFDAIPGILLAVPFGTLADKRGRKWVFIASLMGLELSMAWTLFICYFRSLPLELTWISSAFLVIGGGPIVASAIGLTMMSDIVPPERRTGVFLYFTAGVLVAELIAPILSARLMDYGEWLPLILALVIQQMGIFVALACPETLHLRDLPEPHDPEFDQTIELQPVKEPSAFAIKTQLRNFKDAFVFLCRDTTMALVIFAFLVSRLGRQAMSMLIRYASKRYNWKIKKAAYLLSFRAATNLVALTVFVPGVNMFLLRVIRLPAHWADLWLARSSIILSTLSFVIMGIAAHPALLVLGLLVFNLGTGYNAALRSVSIHVVGGQSSPDIGRLFAVIAIVESIGVMIAGPALAAIFEWGIELGEPWIGIPFLATAAVHGAVTFVTFIISVKDRPMSAPGYVQVDNEDSEPEDGTVGRRHQD
ncbi:MFS general substrate transporter [Westerdykella ornata]|uniref:MFS general substrate transporter n=1 Tax=Westerdykella ornata TaxID=318751 RepID=A0A6A6JV01_WESOR|nr:MFS general substrate transporter [Westerdykella ornata]KAF2279648.1 MFS general substrate transporter [Westerdykella ornata]